MQRAAESPASFSWELVAGGWWLSGRYFPSFEIKKLSTRKSVTGEHRECTEVTREIEHKWVPGAEIRALGLK